MRTVMKGFSMTDEDFSFDTMHSDVQNSRKEQNEQQIIDSEEEMLSDVCPCCHKKVRNADEEKDLITRLNRIEGQIRGIRRMVEADVYCIDILTQVLAASSALNGFTKVLLTNHIKTCVAEDIQQGRQEKVDELVKILPKLMK